MESSKLGKRITILLVLLLLVPLVSAGDLDLFTLNEEANITKAIRIDGAVNSGISANISVRNPSGAYIINSQVMTYNETAKEHIFNVAGPNNSELGIYPYCITSSLNSVNDTTCDYYKITTTGDDLDVSTSLIYAILLVISVGVFLITLWGAIKIPWKNTRNDDGEIIGLNDLKYFKMFTIVFSYVLFTWIMWQAWNISYAFLSFDVMASFFRVGFYILIGLMFPLIVISFVVLVVRVVDDVKIGKLIDRGISNIR